EDAIELKAGQQAGFDERLADFHLAGVFAQALGPLLQKGFGGLEWDKPDLNELFEKGAARIGEARKPGRGRTGRPAVFVAAWGGRPCAVLDGGGHAGLALGGVLSFTAQA